MILDVLDAKAKITMATDRKYAMLSAVHNVYVGIPLGFTVKPNIVKFWETRINLIKVTHWLQTKRVKKTRSPVRLVLLKVVELATKDDERKK